MWCSHYPRPRVRVFEDHGQPSYSSSSSVSRKENLFSIEIARPISPHFFCLERKGKHLLKNWVTKELWVWRAKSQPYWCNLALFVCLVIVYPRQAKLKCSLWDFFVFQLFLCIFRLLNVRSFWLKIISEIFRSQNDSNIAFMQFVPVLQIKRNRNRSYIYNIYSMLTFHWLIC